MTEFRVRIFAKDEDVEHVGDGLLELVADTPDGIEDSLDVRKNLLRALGGDGEGVIWLGRAQRTIHRRFLPSRGIGAGDTSVVRLAPARHSAAE